MIDIQPVIERGSPVRIRYVAERAPLTMRLYTFTSEDDPKILNSAQPFILTCGRSAYPELRLYLARQLGAFVARVNQGTCGYEPRWNDYACNPGNAAFQRILSGADGRETELFIIPMKRSGTGNWEPDGGVKFIRVANINYYNLDNGKLNLLVGRVPCPHESLCIDAYYGKGMGNDLSMVVNSI